MSRRSADSRGCTSPHASIAPKPPARKPGPAAGAARARNAAAAAAGPLAGAARLRCAAAVTPDHPPPPRLPAVDLARTAALAGMVVFHTVFDLELFGHLPPGTTAWPGPWALLARLVAGSFLFLAGVSLVLAHGPGLRRRAFLRRLAVIAAAAVAVSLATRLAMPQAYVQFGILHAIAAASVVGLAMLRVPVALLVVLAAAVAAAPALLRDPALDAPWLLWLGLGASQPVSVDYVPLCPWLAPFLAGMAAARLAGGAGGAGSARRGGGRGAGRLARALAWPGRHSLPIYLLHQPMLFAGFWLWARLSP
jgi:uncharacterized membrane protein